MHEVSIAISTFTAAMKHVPPRGKLKKVTLSCGPLRGIDEMSMRWAWKSVVAEQGVPEVQIELEFLPWEVHCPKCDRKWTSPDFDAKCECGFDLPEVIGGDELKLVGIEVDDLPQSAIHN